MKRDDLIDVDRGISLFNRGMYFEAHEAWEKVWISLDESPEKSFIQGLIKIAAALHHYRRKEFDGAVRLLESGAVLIRRSLENPWLIDAPGLLDQVKIFSRKMEVSTEPAETTFPAIRKQEG